jgi:hypothetical protein
MTSQFGAFTASELFCAKCQRSQPVREKLLLILPSAELHEYLCTGCGASVGQRSVPITAARPVPKPASRSGVPNRKLLH